MATTIQKTESLPNFMLKVEMLKLRASAARAYETTLTDGNYSHAAQIAKDFELGKEEKTASAARAYETNLTNGNYSHAAQIAKSFAICAACE